MTDLPSGWAIATVDQLGEYLNGLAFKPSDWGLEGLPIIRIQNLTNPRKPLNRTTKAVPSQYVITRGDILLSWSATLDVFVWDREDAVLNQHIFKVTPSSVVEPVLLTHILRQVLEELGETDHLHGSTMKHVNRGPFLAHKVALPPLPEQKRIGAKVERMRSRTSRARTELDRVPLLVSRYKSALLSAAFSGDLTADWREVRGFKAQWGARTIEHALASGLIGLVRSKMEQNVVGRGYPYIRMNHYDMNGRWNSDDLTYVNCTAAEQARFELQPGDVLFNTRNSLELVGKVAIWPEGKPGHVFNNNLLRMRFVADILPHFAGLFMQSPAFRDHLETEKSATTSVAAIYQRQLYALTIPVPSRDEQSEIVRRLDAAFVWLDQVSADYKAASKLLPRLDAAILAKAFRGELVPQDPADESAATTLARVAAARTAAPAARRGRRARAD